VTEKENVLSNVLQKPLSSLTVKLSVVLHAESVIKTVLTEQYSKTAMADML
jgi:hypothetical protein